RGAEGEVAKVGAVVAVIAGEGAPAGTAPVAPSPRRGEGVPSASVAPQRTPTQRVMPLDPFFEVRTPARNYGPARLPGGTAITPLARRLAGEAGIDHARVTPSGPHGRIVARDVEAAAAAGAVRHVTPAAAAGPTAEQIKALYRD